MHWIEAAQMKFDLQCVQRGVAERFRPVRKAHIPSTTQRSEILHDQVEAAGIGTTSGDNIKGQARFFVDDPYRHRVEIFDGEKSI